MTQEGWVVEEHPLVWETSLPATFVTTSPWYAGLDVELPFNVGAHLALHLVNLPEGKRASTNNTPVPVKIGIIADDTWPSCAQNILPLGTSQSERVLVRWRVLAGSRHVYERVSPGGNIVCSLPRKCIRWDADCGFHGQGQ